MTNHPLLRQTPRSNPLCEVNSRPGDKHKQDWEERWVETYLIHEAKKDDWKICLAGNKYRFLASQFTFRKHSEWKGTKHVDLLLYDEKKKRLVVLELKADSESFDTARRELTIYIEELNRLFIENEDEKDGALKAFDLEAVEGVIGYVVCPKNESNLSKSPNTDPFGVYEISCRYPIIMNGKLVKPWNKYQELGSALIIEFDLKSEPTNESIK